MSEENLNQENGSNQDRDIAVADNDIEHKEEEILVEIREILLARSFSGPLPPPELLAEYDKIAPGCAEKIIQQFISQGNHRMRLEKMVIEGDTKRANWGLAAGFTLGLIGLIGAFVVISLGHSVGGVAALIVALTPLVGSFLFARDKRKKELEEKNKLVPENSN